MIPSACSRPIDRPSTDTSNRRIFATWPVWTTISFVASGSGASPDLARELHPVLDEVASVEEPLDRASERRLVVAVDLGEEPDRTGVDGEEREPRTPERMRNVPSPPIAMRTSASRSSSGASARRSRPPRGSRGRPRPRPARRGGRRSDCAGRARCGLWGFAVIPIFTGTPRGEARSAERSRRPRRRRSSAGRESERKAWSSGRPSMSEASPPASIEDPVGGRDVGDAEVAVRRCRSRRRRRRRRPPATASISSDAQPSERTRRAAGSQADDAARGVPAEVQEEELGRRTPTSGVAQPVSVAERPRLRAGPVGGTPRRGPGPRRCRCRPGRSRPRARLTVENGRPRIALWLPSIGSTTRKWSAAAVDEPGLLAEDVPVDALRRRAPRRTCASATRSTSSVGLPVGSHRDDVGPVRARSTLAGTAGVDGLRDAEQDLELARRSPGTGARPCPSPISVRATERGPANR